MKFIDITDKKFNRLTAVKVVGKKKNRIYWLFRCDCGKEKAIQSAHVKSGATESCGCLSVENATKHGGCTRRGKTAEYNTWCAVRSRCLNPNDACFAEYGGRGITICSRWASFSNFLKDMGKKPTHKHTIDRIDNAKGYAPNNCRWATPTEQSRNMRSNRNLTVKGETLCAAAWADLWGVPRPTVYYWLAKCLTTEEMYLKSKRYRK